MLLEIAKPFSLMLSIFSLYGVFYTAFLMPDASWEHRIWLSLELMTVSAGICLISGILFREPVPQPENELETQYRAWREHWRKLEDWEEPERGPEPLLRTLPVQMFCWAATFMVGLFILAWYIETYCILYKDMRPL